jgi:hypothetical protein
MHLAFQRTCERAGSVTQTLFVDCMTAASLAFSVRVVAWYEEGAEEGVISMLYEFGLPFSFWGEAMAFFIHVSNRVTITSLQEATPHQAFYGTSQISPTCVFGAELLMFLFRRISVHLEALVRTWRSMSSLDLDILRAIRAGSSTTL